MDADTRKMLEAMQATIEKQGAELIALRAVASLQTDAQKLAAQKFEADNTRREALKAAARKVAGPGATHLLYVVGATPFYRLGRLYTQGMTVSQPNTDEPKDAPGLGWYVPDADAGEEAPKRSSVTTFSKMAKDENAKPKTGPLAPKSTRPSDQEV